MLPLDWIGKLKKYLYPYRHITSVNFWDPWGLEDIVIAGGAYHKGDGLYQFEFVDSALKKIKDMGGDATLLVADAGWDDSQRFIHAVPEMIFGTGILPRLGRIKQMEGQMLFAESMADQILELLMDIGLRDITLMRQNIKIGTLHVLLLQMANCTLSRVRHLDIQKQLGDLQ